MLCLYSFVKELKGKNNFNLPLNNKIYFINNLDHSNLEENHKLYIYHMLVYHLNIVHHDLSINKRNILIEVVETYRIGIYTSEVELTGNGYPGSEFPYGEIINPT